MIHSDHFAVVIDSVCQELPMRCSAYILIAILFAALPALAASVQPAKPELTGFSTERPARIHDMALRHIDAHDISGALTLVARNGKIPHFDAHGVADIESKRPMSEDSCSGSRP
jgi:CubicO group peptidase (beta-lactamase class C family)